MEKQIAGGQLTGFDVLIHLVRVGDIAGAAHHHRDAATLLVQAAFGSERNFRGRCIRSEQRRYERHHLGIRRDG